MRSHIEHASEDYTSIPDEADEQVRNRIAYASFGNEGLTATANAHGRLLQITRYFGEEQKKFANPSGFVCVEFAELPPPYFIVTRLARFESHTKSSKNGMRFEIKASDIPPLPQLAINVKPLFRHLDFSKIDQDPTHVYVGERNKEENVLRIRTKTEGHVACLCLSLFINGRAQKLSGNDKTIKYTIDPSELPKDGELKIALTYTLGQISPKNENINSIKPVPSIESWRVFEESEVEFKKPSFNTHDAHLNFALRRNLEHILSVCSIPVAESSAVAAVSDKIPLIALTCGDVSGHRISTAASL